MTTVDEHQVRLTAHEAQANLRTMLELCSAGKLRCSEKTGRPASATVASVAAHLVQGDFYRLEPIASFAWPLLLQAGGLATVDGGRLQLTARGLAALREPPEDVIRGLWRRWLTHGVIDEFSRIDAIKGQGARNVLTAARPRREIVGQALASCPPDRWVGIDGLFASMRRRRISPTIVRNEMALWKLYLVDAHYGSFGYDGHYGWRWSRAATRWLCSSSTRPHLVWSTSSTSIPAVCVTTSTTPRAARTWTRSAATTVCTRSGSRAWAATRSAWLAGVPARPTAAIGRSIQAGLSSPCIEGIEEDQPGPARRSGPSPPMARVGHVAALTRRGICSSPSAPGHRAGWSGGRSRQSANGDLNPWTAAILASLLVTWVTFVTCFLSCCSECVSRHRSVAGSRCGAPPTA